MRKFFFSIFLAPFILFGKEIFVQEIILEGSITNPKQEISGMDWYGENLFFLPENLGGYLFVLSKDEIQEHIMYGRGSLKPKKTIFNTPDYSKSILGFDGFEAIAFDENDVYISIEAEQDGMMVGYLAWGSINPNSFEINIGEKNIQKVETPIQIDNLSFESIISHNKKLLLLYEANGSNLREDPYQLLISVSDLSLAKIQSPNIEYRLTDATRVINNKFWAINYYWPGDEKDLKPGIDRFKKNKYNDPNQTIERLVEFKIKKNELKLTKKKPVDLMLEEGSSRNWEAVVRFGESGFLIATDKYPRMILAYVKL